MKKKLIALYPILFEAKQYKIGDELPVNNNEMTEKWISAETAVWKEEEKSSDFSKEDYEKEIAELKEIHAKEIEKITAEKEDVESKLSELLTSQMHEEIQEDKENIDKEVNEDVQKTEEESSKSKTTTKSTKSKS